MADECGSVHLGLPHSQRVISAPVCPIRAFSKFTHLQRDKIDNFGEEQTFLEAG